MSLARPEVTAGGQRGGQRKVTVTINKKNSAWRSFVTVGYGAALTTPHIGDSLCSLAPVVSNVPKELRQEKPGPKGPSPSWDAPSSTGLTPGGDGK